MPPRRPDARRPRAVRRLPATSRASRPDSDTETFVALRLEIENWRWAGVPILIRAGKSLPGDGDRGRRPPAARAADPVRPRTGSTAPGTTTSSCASAGTPGVTIWLRAKTPGKEVSQPVSLDLDFAEELGEPPQPYERLLADALRGDDTLFPRWEVIEETWRIVQPLLDEPPPLESYEPGTWGPAGAEAPRRGAWRLARPLQPA